MENKQNAFSWKRYCNFMRLYMSRSRKELLLKGGAAAGCMVLLIVLMYHNFSNEVYQATATSAVVAFIYMILVFSICGSLAFACMKKKSGRISTMMIPATRSEKFWGLLTINVFGVNLLLILTYFITDAICSLVEGSTPWWCGDSMAKILNNPDAWTYVPPVLIGLIGYFLIGQAVYVLGSAIWPKNSFIKTFAATYVLQVVLAMFVPVMALGDWFGNFIQSLSLLDWTESRILATMWVAAAAVYVVLILIYWLAWRRYKSLQLVQRFIMD